MFGNTFIGRTYRKIIASYASKNSDPQQVAHMIVGRISNMNEGWLMTMDDFLKVPETKEEWVYANAPELRQYDTWVNETIEALKTEIAAYFAEVEAEEAAEEASLAAKEEQIAKERVLSPKSGKKKAPEGQPENPVN